MVYVNVQDANRLLNTVMQYSTSHATDFPISGSPHLLDLVSCVSPTVEQVVVGLGPRCIWLFTALGE